MRYTVKKADFDGQTVSKSIASEHDSGSRVLGKPAHGKDLSIETSFQFDCGSQSLTVKYQFCVTVKKEGFVPNRFVYDDLNDAIESYNSHD